MTSAGIHEQPVLAHYINVRRYTQCLHVLYYISPYALPPFYLLE
jgi:hypothetical protein